MGKESELRLLKENEPPTPLSPRKSFDDVPKLHFDP